MHASSSFVQKVRNGVAQFLVAECDRLVASTIANRPEHDILQFSIDCTTENLKVGSVIGPHQIFLTLAKHSARIANDFVVQEILCPIRVLDEENAECILAGLKSVLPAVQDTPERKRALILNSDSHAANKRLFRHFAAQSEKHGPLFALHSFCVMHMTCAALVAVIREMDVINGAFCATLQLHKGHTMSKLTGTVHSYIDTQLEIVYEYDESWRDARKANKAIIDLCLGQTDDDDAASHKARRDTFELLLDYCPTLWFDLRTGIAGRLIHFCPLGCCTSREVAVAKIKACVDGSILGWRPKIPALNRWTRLWQPLGWWTAAFYFFGLVPAAFMQITPKAGENFQIALHDLFTETSAAQDSAAYRAREGARWKKASKWMSVPHMLSKLVLILTVMTPPMALMNDIFTSDRRSVNAIDYSAGASSPVQHCINQYWEMLRNVDSRCWHAFCPSSSQACMQLAFRSTMMTAGNLWMRCVRPFKRWHWGLGLLVDPRVGEATKAFVERSFLRLNPDVCDNCMDHHFTRKIWKLVQNGVGLRSKEMLQFLKDVYSACQCNNVAVECRFGRQRNYNATCRGRDPSIATVSSKHVLAEAKFHHAESARRWQHPHTHVVSFWPIVLKCRLTCCRLLRNGAVLVCCWETITKLTNAGGTSHPGTAMVAPTRRVLRDSGNCLGGMCSCKTTNT